MVSIISGDSQEPVYSKDSQSKFFLEDHNLDRSPSSPPTGKKVSFGRDRMVHYKSLINSGAVPEDDEDSLMDYG